MTIKTLLERIDELIPHLQFGALHGSFHNAEIARKTNQGMAAQLLSDLRPLVEGKSMAEYEAARANELFQQLTELGFHGGTIYIRVSAEDAAIIARSLKAYTGITK